MNNILPPFISKDVYDAMTTDQKIAALETVLVVYQKQDASSTAQDASNKTARTTKITAVQDAITALQA